MLDLSKYPKRVFTEEEAKKEVANIVTVFAIEGMQTSEEEQQIAIDYLTGKISEEEYHKRFREAD